MEGPARGATYRDLIEADLTGPVDIESASYSGIVSAGAFTHGHLGPEALLELLRIGAPSARCVIAINSAHFESHGFRALLDQHHRHGVIGAYHLTTTPIYQDAETDNPD